MGQALIMSRFQPPQSHCFDEGGYDATELDGLKPSSLPRRHPVFHRCPTFLEFLPGYGLHQGLTAGRAASHGCIRIPYWKARQFYNAARIGTSVVIKP
jgi:hypothetical protein